MNRRQLLVTAGAYPGIIVNAWGVSVLSPSAPLRSNALVLAIGDSLTAGYGASREASWPAQLAKLTGWWVVNKGVNGDTSAGVLYRLKGLLKDARYDAVMVAIGGNDMLRGVPLQTIRENLSSILRESRASTPHVALIAAPFPDLFQAAAGKLVDAEFYEGVAASESALLIPDVYSRVLSNPTLRSDPIHGNAQGYAVMARQFAEDLRLAGWLETNVV